MILGLPAATPVTAPVVEFTVASAVLSLLQVPPVVGSVSVTELPMHTGALLVSAGTTTKLIGMEV